MKNKINYNFKECEQLDVYKGDMFAGILKRTASGCEFSYDSNYLKDPKSLDICFNMKRQDLPLIYSGDNLPPFFAGLLPEGLRLKSLVKNLKTSEDDLFTLLAAVGDKCVGDVYVKGSKEGAPFEKIKLQDVDFYELFSRSVADPSIPSEDESFAGIQEKMSASMISFPVSVAKKDKQYILKLNPKDKPQLIQNEHLSLKLAKKCGLSVNESFLVEDKNGNKGLLVERFDRVYDHTLKEFKKIHQEDACQLLNQYPANKYRISFNDILKIIQSHATAPTIEITKLLQLKLFSYLVGNGDLHAKNISVQTIKETEQVRLTPFYDIVCTYIYKDHKMALKMDGRDDNLKRKNWLDLGLRFNLKEKSLSKTIDKLCKKFSEHYEMLFLAMSEKEKSQYQSIVEKRLNDLSP